MPNQSFSPLNVTGMNTGITSGSPAAETAFAEKRARAEREVSAKVEKAQGLINELGGKNGAIVAELIDLYISRVTELINADKECKLYDHLLTKINHHINVGEKIINERTKNLQTRLQSGMAKEPSNL